MKNLRKKIGSIILTTCLLGASFAISGNLNSVSATTKSTSNYQQYYSWAGLKIFKTGVLGYYDSNGSRVTSFNSTFPKHSTGLAWSSRNETADWTSKTNRDQAQVYGQAIFTLGVSTSNMSIGVQSTTKGITSTGKP